MVWYVKKVLMPYGSVLYITNCSFLFNVRTSGMACLLCGYFCGEKINAHWHWWTWCCGWRITLSVSIAWFYFWFCDVLVSLNIWTRLSLSIVWMVGVPKLYEFLWTATISVSVIFPLSPSWVVKGSVRLSCQSSAAEEWKKPKGKHVSCHIRCWDMIG